MKAKENNMICRMEAYGKRDLEIAIVIVVVYMNNKNLMHILLEIEAIKENKPEIRQIKIHFQVMIRISRTLKVLLSLNVEPTSTST